MLKAYIERLIQEYFRKDYSPTPQGDMFNNSPSPFMQITKISNGLLVRYTNGDAMYCANEKALSDEIISRAVRSKMRDEDSKLYDAQSNQAQSSATLNKQAGRI